MYKTDATNATRKRSSKDWAPKFLQALSEFGVIKKSCEIAGINRRTFYRRRDKHKKFAMEVKSALRDFRDSIEAEIIRRGRDGVLKPVFYRGVMVGEIREFSDALLLAAAKAHNSKYRDKSKVELKGEMESTRTICIEDVEVVAQEVMDKMKHLEHE